MDGGSVSREGPKRPPDRRRLLLFLLAGRCGSPGGVPARRCLSALAEGLEALGPRAPAARVASRASALFLLVQVPVPRLAAAAPRRPRGDRERSRLGPRAPPAGRCCAWRCQPGLVPGVACAAGPLHLCHGRVPALASARRELSLSAGCLQLEHKRRDFTSAGSRKLYFDTHALVCLFEENGFTTQQAEIIVSALVKITEANMDIVYKDMVTKMQQKIKLELHQLKQQIMYSLNERKLLEMRTEMVALHAQQDRAVTQTDRKIDTEVAGLKTMLESHKLDNIKYLAGSVFTCLTVALGFYRLWI
ncbi:mitochondrial calcium uniporter regulator 1 isoform X6 [Myotis daubentonii]|uniref:mitochondrial calcium uniporter regulator 1 isoform X6 n=1 Tax=Myotis daubentonii TaxID=98922 RepID=UPI002872D197|nr:mitochondrial calcium uniporter regulator 1 isoform X6 [Myotis daubentonii]